MEPYLIKMILLQVVFLAFYLLCLEREKVNRFKRFYLLLTLLASLIIPCISTAYNTLPSANKIIFNASNFDLEAQDISHNLALNITQICWAIYAVGVALTAIKFLAASSILAKKILNSEKRPFGRYLIVFNDENQQPHSFWKYIFISKKDFEN